MLKKIINKTHILHNIFIKNRFFLKKKTYSMDKEDLEVINYFENKNNGFYVDVGCYHPLHRNNTYLLFKKNWSGINIDVSSFSIDLFNFMRPNDLNYNFAVSNSNGLMKYFFQKNLSQLSTTDKEQARRVFQGKIKEKFIKSFTLDSILEKDRFSNSKIDFLNIDVEGADFKVIEGLSFEKYQPELICIEIHDREYKNNKTYKFLTNLGYELIWNGIFSFIFKKKIK